LWVNKLQTEIVLSTMESEYVALSCVCKHLFLLMGMVHEIGKYSDLPAKEKSYFHVWIHKNNVDALLLVKLESCRMTPCSKHNTIKHHWFRKEVEPRGIILIKIITKEQLGDIFTNGLGQNAFRYLGKKLMGWEPKSFYSEGNYIRCTSRI